MRSLARLARHERGQMLMMAAILTIVLVGFAGLAVDAGFMFAQRRQAQSGADLAALAAARILFQGGTESSAVAAAMEYAAANGFNDESDDTITVNIPPAAGQYEGSPNYVEVVVDEEPATFFIQAIIPDVLRVRARGVAGFELFPEPYALVVLDTNDCQAYSQEGSASIAIAGGGIMVNSDCALNAFNKTGSGSTYAEGAIDVAGGSSVSGSGAVSPEPRTVSWTVADPLSTLPPPPLGEPAAGSPGTAAAPVTWTYSSGGNITLSPGTYYGGFASSCVCTITLLPGTYVMAGGGFTKSGGANFTGDGVTIYVTTNPTNPTGDGAPKPFSLSGSGVLDLSPPTSGIYQGITLWQDEAISSAVLMRGSNDLVSGIIYTPGAALDISGDSELGTVQLVVKTFRLSGNAPLNVTYGEFRVFEAPEVVLVE